MEIPPKEEKPGANGYWDTAIERQRKCSDNAISYSWGDRSEREANSAISFIRIPDLEETCETSSGGIENRENATLLRRHNNDRSVQMSSRVPPRARSRHRPTGAARSSIIPAQTEQGRDTATERITAGPANTSLNIIVGRHEMVDPSRGPIFRHTDSGWRLAIARAASQPSEAGSGSTLEMPPTYSEAG
ncbi:hypothetical protein PM082_015003 [Marasmius tenuissimus]|nr:hypothetical protein PM082_015003 [Marasmius tenuissimus]